MREIVEAEKAKKMMKDEKSVLIVGAVFFAATVIEFLAVAYTFATSGNYSAL